MKLFVLYEELAAYFIACISHLANKHNVEVHILRKEISKDAPFDLNISKRIKIYNRSEYNDKELEKLLNNVKPDAVFCGGWSYPPYLSLCKRYNSKIPVILGF